MIPLSRLPLLALVAAALFESTPGSAATSDQAPAATKPTIVAVRVEQRPVIDGHLDESLWSSTAVITDLRQIRPGNGAPPSEATEIRVAYDKDALYIGAHMIDRRGPGAITANTMKQGSRLPDDDRLAIVIDPFGTGRGAYRFEVNLNSVRNDMLYQGGQPQAEWTVIWETAAVLTDDGWSAEIAIPFKTLPFDPAVDSWGFNVSRAIRSRAEENVWVSRNRSWGPSIVGELTGIRDVDDGVGLDIVPTLGLRQLQYHQRGTDFGEVNPSMELYYRITPGLSASLTANTDFSATDADERQVNLTRFSLFFPEKRDFFLKDADLFDFGRIGGSGGNNNAPRSLTRSGRESARPFFSRKLGLSPDGTPVDLDYGGKLSGRAGRWRIGMLTVRQDAYNTGTGAVINPSTLAVARVAADVLSESSIGMVATSGDPLTNNSNSLVGADFLYQNTRFPGGRTLEGEAWVQRSSTSSAVGSETALGLGGRLIDSDGLRMAVNFRQLGKGFRPALGFVSRAGVRNYDGEFGYTNLHQGRWLQSIYSGVDANRIESVDGPLQTQVITLRPAEIEYSRRDALRFFYGMNREVLSVPFVVYLSGARRVVIPSGNYRFDDYGFDLSSGPQRRLSMGLTFRRGEFYDGKRLGGGVDVNWKQSKYFSLRGSYDFNDIDLPTGSFSTRVLAAGADINFSTRLTWTNLLQYDNVSETAGLQSHLHFIPKAGQSLSLIIKHASEDLDHDGNFRSLTSEYGARLSYTLRF
jgi:Carbohydrate family 9 binding domain-like/Domain of unknown function (DUF5916)